jgi:hypothetical protein
MYLHSKDDTMLYWVDLPKFKNLYSILGLKLLTANLHVNRPVENVHVLRNTFAVNQFILIQNNGKPTHNIPIAKGIKSQRML